MPAVNVERGCQCEAAAHRIHIDLLGVLILMAAVVIEQLLSTIYASQNAAAQTAGALIHRADAALAMLRADVWGASDMRVTADGLEILDGNGPRIVWSAKADGRWTRNEAGAAPRAWRDMPAVRFEAGGALVTVIVGAAVVEGGGGAAGTTEDRAVLCSQRLLAQRQEGGVR